MRSELGLPNFWELSTNLFPETGVSWRYFMVVNRVEVIVKQKNNNNNDPKTTEEFDRFITAGEYFSPFT